jgi:hypothetical protein
LNISRPHTGVGWGKKIYSHSRRIMEWGPRKSGGVPDEIVGLFRGYA